MTRKLHVFKLFLASVFLLMLVSCAEKISAEKPTPKNNLAEKISAEKSTPKKDLKEKPVHRPNTATEIENLKAVFNKMWVSDSVQFDVRKKVVNALAEKTTLHSGKFYFSKGLVRVKFSKPSVSEVVIDEKYIWHAQKLPKDFGGWQISRIKKSLTNRSQALLNLMFGDHLHWDKLKVVGINKKGGFEGYVMKPISSKDFPGITKMAIVIQSDTKVLTRVRQWDEVENEVTYDFSNQNFDQMLSKSFFSYKPPKGAEVSYFN